MKHVSIKQALCWIILAVSISQGLEARPPGEIVLGAATDMNLLEGRESIYAVRMAVEELNAKGGITVGDEKLPIRLEEVDLDCAWPNEPISRALERLEALIVQKKVEAMVVGPFRSEILLSGMDIISRHKIPLLGSIAMSTASETKILKDIRYKYIFRVCFNSKYLVDYLINTMKLLREQYGLNKVYIMTQDAGWARTTASHMVRLYFDRSAWKIIGLEHYPTGTADFQAGLVSARNKGAEVILLIFDMPESGILVKQWAGLGGEALLCGFISPMVGPSAWHTFHGKISGTLNVIFELGNIPSSRWPASITFHKAFFDKYGRQIEAGHGPAPSYDSVFILADAIERAGSTDPDKMVDALEKTDRMGVMGRIRFHRGHQVIFGDDLKNEALGCVIQWGKDGRRKIVYPLSIADGQIDLPPPAP